MGDTDESVAKVVSGKEQSSAPASASRKREGEWLVGGGEMGKCIRAMDWSATPLGPIDSWPQSLRTTVGLCLASNFPISIAWGPRHNQIYNDGYWPICGEKHPSSMGQDFSECWASAWPAIGLAFERALLGETSFLENIRMFLDRNGYLEETFFTFSFSPIRDESGGVGGLFHPVTEVTPRMLSERRTRALRDLGGRTGKALTTTEALTSATQVLADYDLDLPFVLIYRTDGVDSEAHLTASTGVLVDGPLAPVSLDPATSEALWPIQQVLETGQVLQVDGLTSRFGGFVAGPYPEAPKVALVTPLSAAGDDRPFGVIVFGTSSRLPLSENYRAFCELLASSISTGFSNALAREQERSRAETLAELDRAKTRFFSNVSHEFRTPLTLMLGPIEDELNETEDPLPKPRLERLATAHRNSLRLLKLVNTLLDFSRIEAGKAQANFEPTDLALLTSDLASGFRSALEKAHLMLTVNCPPLTDPIFVDRDMWEKIVLNLLSNAFKHTFEGGIIVTLSVLGEYVELSVEDTGVGIPRAELPRLFERFHRVKGTRSRSHEGTGIGLALVSELARQHGGDVSVTSEEGKGSTFTVSLKRGRGHLPGDQVRASSPPGRMPGSDAYIQEATHWSSDNTGGSSWPSSEVSSGVSALVARTISKMRPRIVLADDNADMREYVERLLSEQYDLLPVPNGARALDIVLAEPPDLVLTDVMMPEMDGFALLREIRRNPKTRTIPVIVLSARAGEEAAVQGLAAGADDYLAKPFSARELLARVRTHLELARVRREAAKELEQANTELEAFSHSVSHDLRAPLRAIDGFSRIVLAKHASGLDAEGFRYLERIRAATTRMSHLIDDLIELSRVSRAPVKRERIDLSRIARDVSDEVLRRDPSRTVTVEVAPDIGARCDARLLTVVFENLIGNAVKFTEQKPDAKIRVGSLSLGRETAYFVKDDGAGFDMAYADKLFRPFSRLHRNEDFEGTGIGLATVQRVISRHGGRVWAEGALGEGAAFYFTLSEMA